MIFSKAMPLNMYVWRFFLRHLFSVLKQDG